MMSNKHFFFFKKVFVLIPQVSVSKVLFNVECFLEQRLEVVKGKVKDITFA